jgi:ParB family chromosome partitioning protein
MSNIQQIPLAQLRLSPRNARKTGGLAIGDLAASIVAEGLLQNLVVTAANDGHYDVEAGGRRLRALQLLDSEGRLPDALASIPCHVVTEDVAGEASLAENTIREAMHPADQFDAFTALVDDGKGLADVAARFGVSDTFVKQRLRLSRARPEFLDMYRAGEMTLDQLQALATTDNHELQRQAWYTARGDWDRDPRTLRNYVTREKMPSTARLAKFVGIDNYKAGGGEVIQDLFSTSVWLADHALVDKLAMDKLEAKAEALRGDGWSWVECWLDLDYGRLNEHRELPEPDDAQVVYADPAHESRLAVIEKCISEIENLDEDELTEEQRDTYLTELGELEENRQAILDASSIAWPRSIKTVAGTIVAPGNDGSFDIRYGRLRPGQKVDKQGTVTGTPGATSGGEAAKPKAKPEISDALRAVLSTHRSAVAAARLAADPTLAHCVLLEQLLTSHWPGAFGCNGLHLGFNGNSGTSHVGDESTEIHSAVSKVIAERMEIIKQVPRKGTLDFLLKQTASWRLDLQAALVAAHFNGTTGSDKGHDGVAAIHRITGFSMADHWTPTSDDFLGRIHADLVAEAVTEARGKEAASQLAGLKKAERVATAAKLLAGTGWLPKPLRGADYGKKASADAARASKPAAKKTKSKAAKKAAKKAPAKKAAAKKVAKAPAKKTTKKVSGHG